ncbi:MAG: threonine aldolase family protein [Butyricicoccaceae bacterium]
MLFFVNDYGFGAHPKVLEHLTETNMQPLIGYGNDEITASAAEKIKAACACPEGQVYFLTGGTQTNMVVIDALLRPYEGVVASSCGHVNTHEAGAIESTGHKVLTVPHKNGKLDADDLREYIETFYADESHNHMVFPGMVYISHPSEYGTLYTKNELERISAVCKEFDLPLFLDGARLGYGLTADTDVTLADIARLTDVFYIGGTKMRRAVRRGGRVHTRQYAASVQTMVKRHGAMVAKGRLNAVQFDALFTDGLYEKICAPAVRLALKLRDGLAAKGYRFAIDSPTNQQFIIVENSRLLELGSKVAYSFIEKYDAEHTVIRLATSWATTEEQVDELLNIL